MAKYESYKVGDSEFSFVSFPLIVERHEYAYNDLDASFKFTIPVDIGCRIVGVAHEVKTAFGGGTPAIQVGDGSTADKWLTTTALTETVAGDFVSSFATVAGGQTVGTTPAKVVVTGSTQLTSGEGYVYIFKLDVATNWRTSGQW